MFPSLPSWSMLNPWGRTLSESSCVGSSSYTKLWSFKKEEPTFSFCAGPSKLCRYFRDLQDKYFIRCSDVADLGLFQIASQLLGKPCPYSSENTFLTAPKAVFHNCYVPVIFPCTQGRFVGLLAMLPSTFRTLSAADLEWGRHGVPLLSQSLQFFISSAQLWKIFLFSRLRRIKLSGFIRMESEVKVLWLNEKSPPSKVVNKQTPSLWGRTSPTHPSYQCLIWGLGGQ